MPDDNKGMSHEKRLGWAALVMGLLGTGALYLWPNERWIGWSVFSGGVVSGLIWAYLEIGPLIGDEKILRRIFACGFLGISILVVIGLIWPKRSVPIVSKPRVEPYPALPPHLEVEAKPANPVNQIKDPLEIVAFRSDFGISVSNDGPIPIHVLSLVLRHEYETKSFGLALDIGPGKISQQLIHEEGILHMRSSRKLADRWQEHIEKMTESYGSCGTRWIYFAPADPSLQQLKDNYTKQNVELGYNDISGSLYYRLAGAHETKEQVVPLVVTMMVNNDTCPRDVIFTPHPLPPP